MMVGANRNVTEKWLEQVGTSSVDGRADQNLVEGWSEQRMVRNRLGCHRRMIERSPEDNQGRSECRQKKTQKLSKDTLWSLEDGQEVRTLSKGDQKVIEGWSWQARMSLKGDQKVVGGQLKVTRGWLGDNPNITGGHQMMVDRRLQH
ncbi:unnamed protein product [Ilex paraguariensis]|uniref:Uncharacterized protein n=1 Tax=Ilex paraguariensis TaxID=185542 RepID=A0ABC8TTC8_9AQUA